MDRPVPYRCCIFNMKEIPVGFLVRFFCNPLTMFGVFLGHPRRIVVVFRWFT